jgi:hypothetical protein
LAAADTKRWKGAKEQYEKKVNDIYFRIYQYVENGVLLPEPNPYAEETFESFSQEAHFNPDGSIPAISYRVDKTAPELYYYTLQWMKEYYIKPELVVKESHKNQSIILESGCGSALFPNTQKLNALDKLGFSGKFDMKIEFQDGQYTVTYIHLNFADSGGEKVNINFSEVFANTKITEEGNGRDLKFQGIRTYEKKVNQLLTSLNHYLITTEFISQ